MIPGMNIESPTTNRVSVSFDQRRAFIRIVGRVTRETVPLLAAVFDTMRKHAVTDVFVDLTGVSVIDRNGAHFLARSRRECEECIPKLHWAEGAGTATALAAS